MNDRLGDVQIFENITKETFLKNVYPQRVPAILRGIDVGQCVQKWTVDYLCKSEGDKAVKVHVSSNSKMDFIEKNYAYRTLPFDELVRRCAEPVHENFFLTDTELYYLRALGTDNRKDVANIKEQFPALADDVIIPEYFDPDQFFSSVLRVSSPGLHLWTHYDMMDNLLIQVRGDKKVVLFSPREAKKLYLKGDKSPIVDLENPDLERYPDFAKACQYHCMLHEGDVLFIPALWFHNVVPLDFSVAVNVFWKNLSPELYDAKDPYGNKDVLPASQALQSLNRALKLLDKLPEEYKDFYGRRMVMEIEKKTFLDKT